jgi:Leucine-rich repeat (LRR) protein
MNLIFNKNNIEKELKKIENNKVEYIYADFNLNDTYKNKSKRIFDKLFKKSKYLILNLSHNDITDIDSICNLENLIELTLSNNKLRSLSLNINKLKKLKELYMSSNKLILLPETITELTKLEILDCTRCKLYSLPFLFSSLINLTELYLGFNDFDHFPEIITELKLHTLDLQGNNLSMLPKSFSKMKSLKDLNLSINNFYKFPETICKLYLEYLNIEGNFFQEIPYISMPTLKNINIGLDIFSYPKYIYDLPLENNNWSKKYIKHIKHKQFIYRLYFLMTKNNFKINYKILLFLLKFN